MDCHVVYFITAIFIPLLFDRSEAGAFYGCVREREDRLLHKCLSRWSNFRDDREPSAFLTDDAVVNEICLSGTPIGHVDACVHGSVSAECGNIIAYWQGIRDLFSFVCERRKEYSRYSNRKCRTNQKFVVKFEKCVASNYQRIYAGTDYCLSVHIMKNCFTRSLSEHCTPSATEFFCLVFETQLEPTMLYSNCSNDKGKAVDVESIDAPQKNGIETNHDAEHKFDTHDDGYTSGGTQKRQPGWEKGEVYRSAAIIIDYTSGGTHAEMTPLILLYIVTFCFCRAYADTAKYGSIVVIK